MEMNNRLKSIFKNADLVTNILVAAMFALAAFQSVHAQCPTPPGNPTVYGSNSWIGYVYSGLDNNNPPQNTFTTTVYRGFITQPEQFNLDLVNAAMTGANVCGSYADSFSMRYRMKKTFAAGYYTFTIGGDDGERLSFDGGSTWAMQDWNYHSYQTTTATFFMSGEYFLVLENYDQGGQSRVSFAYTYCNDYSTAPTAISGNNSICNGSSTTLTATGGTLATGATYQWGTGNTVGNSIINGQTTASITVSPTANTTYWVRRLDANGCGTTTAGATQLVTVTANSTAPTVLSGGGAICLGSSATLIASGGTTVSGSVYEWGTGAVGSNIIAGQTTATLSVTPTTTTTYWVRKTNTAPCVETAALTATVTVNNPPGDEVSYGNNTWIGYVYATVSNVSPPADAFTATYRGYITEPETFDQNWGGASVSGPNVCGSYDNRFAVRFKMQKNFTPGYYTFTVGGDDGYRLSLDGGTTYTINNWNDHGYTTSNSNTLFLSGNMNLILDFYEQGGDARVTFSYISCTDYSTAPTGISGTSTICTNTATTLTATGGYAAAGTVYQWGTGTTVGNNIIGGNTASITVTPGTTSTNYWVRRMDPAPCNLTTTGAVQLVTVVAPSTNPNNITGTNNICIGGSTTLTANGGTHASAAVYQWGTGSVGNNIIAGESNATLSVSPSTNTTYWVRRLDAAPCNTITSGPTYNVTVVPLSTAPTSISNAAALCSPNGGITLMAMGGTSASGSTTYQWGTGSVIGTAPIGGQTNSTYYVNPTAVTTYWVRRFDPTPCATYTSGVTVTIYPASTAPTNITGTNSICVGGSTTLTATGGTTAVNGSFQWGTGSIGNNIITGETNNTITVSPTTNTTYWVRRTDSAPCTTLTSGPTFNVSVSQLSTAPTSISNATSLCSPNGGITLNAIGGTSASGSTTYQWGTGSVIGVGAFGGNQNNQYVNPTAVTTYWVRRFDPTPCGVYTSGATVIVYPASTAPTNISATSNLICSGGSTTLTASGGTHSALASYQWGFGTAGTNIIAGETAATITVSPTTTTSYWVRRTDSSPCTTITGNTAFTVTVNQRSAAPTAITGPSSLCYTAGGGTLTAIGAAQGTNSAYQWGFGAVGTNIQASTVNTMYINPSVTTTYWVRMSDPNPCGGFSAAVTFTVTVNTTSTAPSGISGTLSICSGASTTLTATGGTAGIGSGYEWGFGTNPGSNTIAGQNGITITVSPTTTTTYWVRRVNGTPCTSTTYGPNVTVTVNSQSTAPTSISGAGTNCPGVSNTLTATGGTAASGSTYQWGIGSVIGTNPIAGQTAVSLTVSPTTTTTYWVRRFDAGCGTYCWRNGYSDGRCSW